MIIIPQLIALAFLAVLIPSALQEGMAAVVESSVRPVPAHVKSFSSNERCIPHEKATEQLGQLYGEGVIGTGDAGAVMIELWATGPGDTWTITMTGRNGMTCLLVHGDSWYETRRTAR